MYGANHDARLQQETGGIDKLIRGGVSDQHFVVPGFT